VAIAQYLMALPATNTTTPAIATPAGAPPRRTPSAVIAMKHAGYAHCIVP
jgi:hypothetical protein